MDTPHVSLFNTYEIRIRETDHRHVVGGIIVNIKDQVLVLCRACGEDEPVQLNPAEHDAYAWVGASRIGERRFSIDVAGCMQQLFSHAVSG